MTMKMTSMKYLVSCISMILSFYSLSVKAQEKDTILPEGTIQVEIDGQIYNAIPYDGDTLIMAQLDEITYTSAREFRSEEDYQKYLLYQRYAAKVYPYAVKAIRIFHETDYVTQNMNKRDRKKHIKRLQNKLKDDLQGQLTELTKLQGTILTKMIERELDKSTYDLVSSLRGRFTAAYWQTLGMFYNYNLKRGYVEGDDYVMDIVLKDFDVSYDLKSEINSNKRRQNEYLSPQVQEKINKP